MNAPDALRRSHDGLRDDACHDSRGGYDVPDGTSSDGDDDGKRSSDASTSHVPSSCARTTNSGNNPSTKDYAMRTMRRSRTSRR